MSTQPVMLITGASSGIGAETARAAAKRGYRLVLAARSKDKLSGLQKELGGPDVALALQCDVQSSDEQPAHALKPEDIAEAVMYAVSQPAHVDVNEILVRPTPALDK